MDGAARRSARHRNELDLMTVVSKTKRLVLEDLEKMKLINPDEEGDLLR